MANGDDPNTSPAADDSAVPGAPPAAPPQGGGPILAALARNRNAPKPTAPGAGDTASSMTKVMHAIAMLQDAISGLPPGSPLHRDVIKGIGSLSRHVGQAGQPTAGVQKTQLQDMLRNTIRNALLQQIMGQQSGAKPDPGKPPGPTPFPAGAQAQAPMPSTPLPGA